MSTKLKTAAVAALLASSAAGWWLTHRALSAENRALTASSLQSTQELARLRVENQRLTSLVTQRTESKNRGAEADTSLALPVSFTPQARLRVGGVELNLMLYKNPEYVKVQRLGHRRAIEAKWLPVLGAYPLSDEEIEKVLTLLVDRSMIEPDARAEAAVAGRPVDEEMLRASSLASFQRITHQLTDIVGQDGFREMEELAERSASVRTIVDTEVAADFRRMGVAYVAEELDRITLAYLKHFRPQIRAGSDLREGLLESDRALLAELASSLTPEKGAIVESTLRDRRTAQRIFQDAIAQARQSGRP